jgi:Ca2+-binding RTX toxin-like protein
MAFTKTPAGATSDFLLLGTDGIDITTVTGQSANVTIDALAGNDQVTVQNTDGVVNGLYVELDEGDDRIFVNSTPNDNLASVVLQGSTIRGGAGDDILFGNQGGEASFEHTAYLQYSLVNGNEGRDLIRTYGMLSSRIEGGADSDTIEVTNVFQYPDRYDGATVQGSTGRDTININLGNTNVVNSKFNGNENSDFISNFGAAVTGNWSNSTIYGGKGDDTVAMQAGVTSSLLVIGNEGSDVLQTGTGNDTVVGGVGWDTIAIAGGNNLVYGDEMDGTGSGWDIIEIGGGGSGSSTVFAGAGNDQVEIGSDGNNIVSSAAGNDTVDIIGNGNNSVGGSTGDDGISILGTGINTIFGGQGNDLLEFDGGIGFITAIGFGNEGDDTITVTSGLNGTLQGADGNDSIIIESIGNIIVGGGAGNDTITFQTETPLTASINGGTGADIISAPANTVKSFVQLNGDSLAATYVNDIVVDNIWTAGDTIVFGNGVDVITGFDTTSPTDVLQTTLGDLGLDQTHGGELYRALGTSIYSGMVAGRSYYLSGTWTTGSNVFTVTADGDGLDGLLVTAGNNGSLTSNSNAVVMIGADLENFTNAQFDTYLG